MTFKDNTPNYNAGNRKVINFGDFCDNWESEKEKLKKTKRSIINNSEVQQHVKNVKSEFNTSTRKWTDQSRDEVIDKLKSIKEIEELDESVKELTDANVANLERFVTDYRSIHSSFETRGVQEGMAALRNADSIEKAIELINNKIKKYESSKEHSHRRNEKEEVINGLKDFLIQLENK